MATMKTLHSDNLTFIDLTDTKKLDVHISSNLPTMQIYDANTSTHSPDWTQGDKLQLTLTVYADSTDVTNDLTNINWYRQIGSGVRSDSIQQGNKVLTISSNELASMGNVISYICSVTYNGKAAENQITFSRTSTGLNGTNGADGTSVNIKGTATSVTPVSGTDYYTIVFSDSSITLAKEGDAYVYDGDLYVCVGLQAGDGTDYFINVGRIQGPAGESAKNIVLNGNSQVFKVSKTNTITPSTITVTGQALNTAITTWEYSTNGGVTWGSSAPGVARNGNIVTITGASMTSNSVVVKASDGTYSDTYTVYKALDGVDGAKGTDGQSASMAFLTNENVTFGANANGQIAATAITTNVVAYNGTTKVTPTIGTIANLPEGMTATIGNAVNNEIPITFTVAHNSILGSASNNNGAITIPVNGPVYTNLIFSWSKVNSGAKGEQGASGSDAYTVVLTNESHTFAGNVSSAMAGTATTQVLAYKGATQQSVTITSVNGKSAAITDTDTGIAGLKFKCSALSGTSPTITFTCTESFVSANGNIDIVLSVGGVSFTKIFTYAIAFKGDSGATGSAGPQGAAATSYWLISSANTIQKTSTGTITVTPSTLTFTGKAQTGTNTPVDYAGRWVIDSSTDGTTYTNLYTSTANEASKSITVTTAYKTIRARMYMAGGTTALLDEQIIPVVTDGTSASLVSVTPSAQYFKSVTGKDGTFTPEYIYLYPRFQNVTYGSWQYATDGGVSTASWKTASGANGLSIGTYNGIASTLRIDRKSTLYTDDITSISFKCVSSNANVYDTVSIAKLFDVDVEEINTRITSSMAEVKATTDAITSRVSTAETSIKTINNNITSITDRVSEAEQKVTSTSIVSTVRQSTDYINDLGKKVGTNEIISKINQTAEAVTINANRIGLLGATNIPDLTADKIKGGTLTLGGSSATTQNGQLVVKNASNADVLKVNKDGIIAKSGHLAVAKDFANQTYNWDTGIWTTTTNTSQLDLGDDYIQMGVYSPSGYSNTMRLLDDGLRFQGIAQAVGSWGSYIGHDTYGDFIIQDTVRSNISFRDASKNEMAKISYDGLYINGPVSGGITSGNAKQWSNVFTKNFTSQHTGYIAIRLGTITRAASSMITIKGHVTSYWDSSSFEASCYFYNGNASFYGTVGTMSNPDTLKEMYFAEGVSDGCVYLILGGSDSTWYYPTVAIDDLSVGYSGNTAYEWNSGWTATLHTGLSSFKTVTSCSRGGMKKVLWSGAVQIGATVTLNESLRNFKFLTCLMGDASSSWGIPLGTFLDDEVSELHFGAIYTGADSIAGGNLYGARFNVLSQKSLSLQSMGTRSGAGAYLRKIVGWR